MKIGIAYNLKDESPPFSVLNGERNEEFDSSRTIDAIFNVLEKNSYRAVRLGGAIDIVERIKKERVEFVFNIAEGYYGRNRESWIPSVLEMMNIPYSGSDPLTLGITLDKLVAKKIFQNARIPSPNYVSLRKIEDLKQTDGRLQYPVVTKPSWEGSSKGIYNSSKALDKIELERSVRTLLKKYKNQPILVEEYIKGREITVGVLGNENPKVLGVMEIVNKKDPGEDFFYSIEVKRNWEDLVDYVSPPVITPSLDADIRRYAIMAYKEFGCRDVARIDFRVSEYSEPYLLEINPLPGLSPDSGDLVIMAGKNGISYEKLILAILDNAFSRYGLEAVKPEKEKIKP